MLAQELLVWSVIIGDQDCIVHNTQIAFEGAKDLSGQVRGIPARKGVPELLTHLVDCGLSHQSHSHLSVANIKIERTGPMPTQGLVKFKKLFDMPAFWIMEGQILYFITIGSGQEGFRNDNPLSVCRCVERNGNRAAYSGYPASEKVL
jgi:hypothetical protein